MLDVLGKSPMKDRIDACDEELVAETDGKPGDDPSKKTGPLSIKEAEEGNQDDDTEHPVPGKATPLPSSANDDVKHGLSMPGTRSTGTSNSSLIRGRHLESPRHSRTAPLARCAAHPARAMSVSCTSSARLGRRQPAHT